VIIGAVITAVYLSPFVKFGHTPYIFSDLENFGARDGHKIY